MIASPGLASKGIDGRSEANGALEGRWDVGQNSVGPVLYVI